MAVARDRKKEVEMKRENILLAAVELFLEKDFYQVTVVEIAERAAIGKGTVYEYFSSKEELFKECFAYCAESYMQSFRKHFSASSSVKRTMYEILSTHNELLKDNRKRLHLLFNERPLSFHELQSWVLEQREELLKGIVALINEGIDKEEIRPVMDVEMAGRIFLALNYVVMGGMLIIDNVDVSEKQITSLLDIYWNGISNRRP